MYTLLFNLLLFLFCFVWTLVFFFVFFFVWTLRRGIDEVLMRLLLIEQIIPDANLMCI